MMNFHRLNFSSKINNLNIFFETSILKSIEMLNFENSIEQS